MPDAKGPPKASSTAHLAPYQFKKGLAPKSPGRPKAFGTLVREKTKNCEELVEILLSIARGEESRARTADRIAATRELLDRGIGKAVETTLQLQANLTGGDAQLELAPATLEAIARFLIPALGPSSGPADAILDAKPLKSLPVPTLDQLIDNQAEAPAPDASSPEDVPGEGVGLPPVQGGSPGAGTRAGTLPTNFPPEDRGVPTDSLEAKNIFPEPDRGVVPDPAGAVEDGRSVAADVPNKT